MNEREQREQRRLEAVRRYADAARQAIAEARQHKAEGLHAVDGEAGR